MSQTFAKMSSGLDRSRKIRKGGREAREVFLWVLRRVSDRNSAGWIPAEEIEDLDFLAEDLMTPVTDVRHGVTRCLEVDLIHRSGDGRVFVTGWDEEWGARKPLTGAERTKRWRDRKVISTSEGANVHPVETPVTVDVTPVTVTPVTNVTRVEREEKREGSQTRARDFSELRKQARIQIERKHCEAYERLRIEFGSDCLALNYNGNGERDLLACLSLGTEAEAAIAGCERNLRLRTLEAEHTGDLKYFGVGIWQPIQFDYVARRSEGEFLAELAKRPRRKGARVVAVSAQREDDPGQRATWLGLTEEGA